MTATKAAITAFDRKVLLAIYDQLTHWRAAKKKTCQIGCDRREATSVDRHNRQLYIAKHCLAILPAPATWWPEGAPAKVRTKISRTYSRLESAELIEIERGAAGRVEAVFLTPAGFELLGKPVLDLLPIPGSKIK